MKKVLQTLVMLTALVCVLAVGASAASFTHTAEALHEMGLFQGTDAGYDLDRAPTRAEAAVMLTRMLGQEAAALSAYEAGEISHPFTDTESWMDAYIAYLYENGYTTGSTATTFNPNDICSDQMYVTFLLRSLGYFESNGDFTYDDAMTFGSEIGLVDLVNTYGDTFLRDNVAALTYTALTVCPQGSSETMYETLVAEGVIPEGTEAGALLECYETAMGFIAPLSDATTFSGTVMGDLTAYVNGYELINYYINGELIVDTTSNMEASLSGILGIDYSELTGYADTSDTLDVYIKDGYIYTNANDDPTAKTASALSDAFAISEGTTSLCTLPVSLLSDYKISDGNYVLNVSADFVETMFAAIGNSIAEQDIPLTLGDVDIYFGVNDDSTPYMGFATVLATTVDGFATTIGVQGQFTVNQIDGTQAITFPTDLDTYTITEAEA